MLRQFGWKGAITLVGEEPMLPYQRPPLSKAWLNGEATAESLALRPARLLRRSDDRPAARHQRVTASTARRKTRHAVGRRHAALRPSDPGPGRPARGGCRCRASICDGVLELRTAADADQLKAALRPGRPAGGDRRRLYRAGGRRLRPCAGRRGHDHRARGAGAGARRLPDPVDLLRGLPPRPGRRRSKSTRRSRRWRARTAGSPACGLPTAGSSRATPR